MEDVNRFARELADAIAAAVAEHPQVEACRERARAAGYEMRDPRSRRRLRHAREGWSADQGASAGSCHSRATRPRNHCEQSPVPALAPHRCGRDDGGRQLIRLQASGCRLQAWSEKRAAGFPAALFCCAPPLAVSWPWPLALSPLFVPPLSRQPSWRLPDEPRVLAPNRPQVGIELVDKRNARRNVQSHDGIVRNVVEILHERSKAVPVRGNQHSLAGADGGCNGLVQYGRTRATVSFRHSVSGSSFGRIAYRGSRDGARGSSAVSSAAECRSYGARS